MEEMDTSLAGFDVNKTNHMDVHEVITRMRMAKELGIPMKYMLDRQFCNGGDVKEFYAYDLKRREAEEAGEAAPKPPGIFKTIGKGLGAGAGTWLGTEIGGPAGGAAGGAAGDAAGEEIGGWIDGLDPIGKLEDLRREIHE